MIPHPDTITVPHHDSDVDSILAVCDDATATALLCHRPTRVTGVEAMSDGWARIVARRCTGETMKVAVLADGLRSRSPRLRGEGGGVYEAWWAPAACDAHTAAGLVHGVTTHLDGQGREVFTVTCDGCSRSWSNRAPVLAVRDALFLHASDDDPGSHHVRLCRDCARACAAAGCWRCDRYLTEVR